MSALSSQAGAWPVLASTMQTSAPGSAEVRNWKRYRYDMDHFTVAFPAEPATNGNDSKSGTRYFCTLSNGNLAYFVEKAELPADLNKSSQQVLDDYIQGSAKAVKAQVKSSNPITLHGNPGREFTLENDTMILQFRVYLVQRSLYQVLVAATKDLAPGAEVQRFQSSFDLLQ